MCPLPFRITQSARRVPRRFAAMLPRMTYRLKMAGCRQAGRALARAGWPRAMLGRCSERRDWKMDSNRRIAASNHVVIIGVLAALIGSVGVAMADDLQICHDESGDVAIAACTRAIESGRLSKRNLAVAYT